MTDFQIFDEKQDPYAVFRTLRPWRTIKISARPMWVCDIMPTAVLMNMTADQIKAQAEIEAAGCVQISDDPEERWDGASVALMRHPEMAISDADEIMIPASRAKLHLVYPLSVATVSEIAASDAEGISRGDILLAIHDAYVQIYADEHKKSSPKSPDDRGYLLNREQTEGPFGVWGHDIGDLMVEGIRVFQQGVDYVVSPSIGS